MEYRSHTPEDTKRIATEFAKRLTGGDVVFLHGDLGSGKTTFVQGLAHALGYEGPVRSPTFTIVNVYPIGHDRIKRIVHVDLYRLKDESELTPLTLEEYLDDSTLLLIEWPKWLESRFGSGYHEIEFVQKDSYRSIIL